MNIGISTVVFERGMWYLAKGIGDKLESDGNKVFYWTSQPIGPINQVEFDKYNVTKAEQSKEQITRWVEDNKIEEIITIEEWIPERAKIFKGLVGRLIDIPMLEQVRIGYFLDGFYEVFDEIWCLTEICYRRFSDTYKNAYKKELDNIALFSEKSGLVDKKSSVKNYFFHPGGWGGQYNRKNTSAVIEAFLSKFSDNRNIDLVISSQKKIEDASSFPDNICFLDSTLNRGQILNLYAKSLAIVYPTLREGLGLTFVEAGWFGKKVIGTDYPPMNEFDNLIPVKVEKTVEVLDSFVPLSYCSVEDLGEKMESFAKELHLV